MTEMKVEGSVVKQPVIFVHSLFRSGSTYLYNVLKRTGKLHVYHEPMHEMIETLHESWEALADRRDELKSILRHGFLVGGYFDEFSHLLPEIKKTFDSSLSFGSYFIGQDDSDSKLKAYIDLLLEGALNAPVLQCTRTVGRIGWLRKNYDSRHVFLLRNPWCQWYSYKSDPYISVTPRLIYSQERIPAVLSDVLNVRGILPLKGDSVQAKVAFAFENPISPADDYFLFFAIWLHSFLSGTQESEVVIDMDALNSNVTYREQTINNLAGVGITSVDFSDVNLHRIVFSLRELATYSVIEDQVIEIFRRHEYSAEVLAKVSGYLAIERRVTFISDKALSEPASGVLEDAYRMREALFARDEQSSKLIARLNLALNQGNLQVDMLSQFVTERDLEIQRLSQTVAERDLKIIGFNEALAGRGLEIISLNQAIVERDLQINDLNGMVSELSLEIDNLSRALVEQVDIVNAFKRNSSGKDKGLLSKMNSLLASAGSNGMVQELSSVAGAEAFFTICSKNFLAHARVLYNSVRPHYPDARFFVVLCDRVDGMFDPAKEPFEFIFLEDLNLPNLSDMAARYNITEFNTAVKPFAFTHLLKNFGFGSVVYLDPDLYFVNKMEELDLLLHDGAEAVLTPHILQPAENDEVHDGKMLLFGIYNLGFLALRNTPAVLTFLAWWGRRLERDCVIRLEEGLFVDQKWADLLPAFVPGTKVIHHPGYNVAYWNLPQRKIVRDGERWLANGEALRFVHFSGNKLDDLKVFSRHSQQVTINSIGDLRHLLDTYREEVYAQGHAFYRKFPYAYSWNGEAGVNLHTPSQLDLAASTVSAEVSSPPIHKEPQGTLSHFMRRVTLIKQAAPIAKQLSGGWGPFAQRAWRAYRLHGWHHVKVKALELTRYRVPPTLRNNDVIRAEQIGSVSPRLLYLDWAIPKPDQDAASVTAKLLMEIFDSLGYRVTFIPCGLKYEEGYFEELVAANVEVIVYPEITSVRDWLAENARNFDVCVLARGPVVWPYFETIKTHAPNARLIFNTVDLHYLREQRQAELTGNKSAFEAALKTRDQEFELIEKCDLTILLSQEEMYTVREVAPEASVVNLPVIFSDIPGSKSSYSERSDILFIGSFPHQPNIDAVLYFVEFVFPIVRQNIPDIRFKVIGANPPESIRHLAEVPGVEILGFVKDLEPIFSEIRLSVAPLRYGAGIKGKIGTSLCYGVPCMATPIALEGMGLVNGKNVLVGETHEELAEAICRAYSNEELWNELSREGHLFALNNYSVSVIRDRVESLLSATTKGWKQIQSAVELDGWDAFQKHSKRLEKEYQQRELVEQSLLPTDGSAFFRSPGFCCTCGRATNFLTSFMYSTGKTPDGREMPNWREHMQCEHCGLVNRMRAALNVMHTYATPSSSSRIYITERLTATYRWLEERYENLQGSEYFGHEHVPGTEVNGIRHEDVMNLSFKEGSFDLVLSFDVLEHVPDPDKAFVRIYSVLDQGGMFIFSVPFSSECKADLIRATLQDDGTIEHHLPPEYHGNPVDPEGGALCFRYFGWDMLERLRGIGFKNVRCLAYWSQEQGYLGKEQYLFLAVK
ncbi:glycosyltransferase [Pseudomonas sp. NFXW11]|uniref:glycosyltransferase n=1 Tax=Pseudomonas sp. NFXW11 TaxID=2819531 RepID=UPI003CE917AA